jgi:hypothetical protein
MMTFMKHHSVNRKSGTAHPATAQTALAAAGNALGDIAQRAQWLVTLDAHLRKSLPPALANHCTLANVRDDTLVFLVSSPVWKAKLRLLGDTLLAAANGAGVPARELTLKVATLPMPPPETTPNAPLSPAGRAALRSAAQSISDPKLQAKLLKLASVP